MRRLILLSLAVVAAGCGSTKSTTPTTTAVAAVPSPATALPGSRVLYRGGGWAVVQGVTRAVAVRLVDGRWHPDRSGRVKIEILGPDPGSTAPKRPQVAAQLTAPGDLVESGLWLDGEELQVKGGGSPTLATIYGAPPGPLAAGRHTAVAYGRTAATGTARAWTFRTP